MSNTFKVITPKGTEIELELGTEVVVTLDGVDIKITIKKE